MSINVDYAEAPIFGQPSDGGPISGSFGFFPMEKVLFGPGCVSKLTEEVKRLGCERILIVTGRTLANTTDLVERIQGLIGQRCVGVFTETSQHVPRASVVAATDMARELDIDGLVSFGGGSAIDTAKAVSMCLAEDVHEAKDLDRLHFYLGSEGMVMPKISGDLLPHISISTTLSAGEFTGWAGITDPERLRKDAFGSPDLTPKLVILDPDVTTATPAWLWASTGMRAVDHAVETIYSVAPQPFADALCLRALEMLAVALPRSVSDPGDVLARGACQVAMWMSIFSLPNVPSGMSHGIGHQLGSRCDLPHGVCSAIMLPVVMDFNRPVTAHRQRLMAEAFGIDVSQMTNEEAAAGASQRVRELAVEMGIKNRLSDWGIGEGAFPAIAADAIQDFMNTTNPVPVKDEETIISLLRQAL